MKTKTGYKISIDITALMIRAYALSTKIELEKSSKRTSLDRANRHNYIYQLNKQINQIVETNA